MSVLLTVSQPRFDFGNRSTTHEFAPRIPSLSRSRPVSPKFAKVEPPSVTSLRASSTTDGSPIMSTQHRGLPPPSAMNLPDPSSRPPPQMGQPLGGMPNPPNQWQGQEDSMRHWLVAKTEEDKRKQEEEKTRQESLRLEQRRIEQSMLRESLQGGVPPHMVPMIYAGIGGANLANVSLDWLQQYAAQLQASQQQQIQAAQSPELRRETRLISQVPYGAPPAAQPQVVPSQAVGAPQPSQGAPLQTTFSAYQPPPPASPRRAPTSAPRAALPRLNTNELYVQPAGAGGPGSAHPLQQSQTQEQASSPSIYFHHWVPPDQKSQVPQTPASKEPSSAHPGSHLSESEYKDSPRKRKAQGGHQANPPPSAGPQYTSPSFSTISSSSGRKATGHVRSRSNASGRGTDSRPESRRQVSPLRSTQTDAAKAGAGDDRRSRDSSRHRDDRGSRPSSEAPRALVREASQSRRPDSAPREER